MIGKDFSCSITYPAKPLPCTLTGLASLILSPDHDYSDTKNIGSLVDFPLAIANWARNISIAHTYTAFYYLCHNSTLLIVLKTNSIPQGHYQDCPNEQAQLTPTPYIRHPQDHPRMGHECTKHRLFVDGSPSQLSLEHIIQNKRIALHLHPIQITDNASLFSEKSLQSGYCAG